MTWLDALAHIEDLEDAPFDPGLVDAFDRMAEKMEGAGDVEAAARELDLDLDPLSEPPRRDYASEKAMREAHAEDLLEELKRRMGEEG